MAEGFRLGFLVRIGESLGQVFDGVIGVQGIRFSGRQSTQGRQKSYLITVRHTVAFHDIHAAFPRK